MKTVVSVIGKDAVGILAKISNVCAQEGASIIEVTQSVMQDMFAMIMLVEIDKSTVGFDELSKKLDEVGEKTNTKIHSLWRHFDKERHKRRRCFIKQI